MYTETQVNKQKEVLIMANNMKTSVPTRVTTGKVRLTYAFVWEPRKVSDDQNDQQSPKDQRLSDDSGNQNSSEKYSCCILIPKEDQRTLAKLQAAINQAILLGEKKGYWQGAHLSPSTFKFPLRDGDQECAEKGEEYAGHWFLNASSSRKPHIVDINRNDIFDQSEVYSGCYARVCLNFYPFNKNRGKGIGCGLEAIQKVADGEPLGSVPIDIDEAFGDDGDLMETVQPAGGYVMGQPATGFAPQSGPVPQQAGYGNQQFQQGFAQQQAPQGFTPQQPSMMQPQGQGYVPIQQQAPNYGMVQPQQGFYPQQMGGASNEFARGIENANSSLPPHLFEDPSNKQVA